jgi:IrrE N-terminal-like domain
VGPDARIDVDQLARHLGVTVRQADELVPVSELILLNHLQDGCFSAATIHLPNGSTVAITNPINVSPGRRDSDLAHEIAHILLGHIPSQADRLGNVTFFNCDPDQEQEANWLAGCLLLSRPLLLRAARANLTPEQVAERHNVSIDMARFRLNASGVYLQIHRARRGT